MSETPELNRKISELDLYVKEQNETIYALEESVALKDEARIKALEDLLKAKANEIRDLKSEIRSKNSEIEDLEIALDRRKHEEDSVKEARKVQFSIEVDAAKEIVAMLPDPVSETYDQFMFRRNLRILFTALGIDVLS